jgi:hypothetical protein
VTIFRGHPDHVAVVAVEGGAAGCIDRVFAGVLDGDRAGIGAPRKVARPAAHLPPAAASTGPHGS